MAGELSDINKEDKAEVVVRLWGGQWHKQPWKETSLATAELSRKWTAPLVNYSEVWMSNLFFLLFSSSQSKGLYDSVTQSPVQGIPSGSMSLSNGGWVFFLCLLSKHHSFMCILKCFGKQLDNGLMKCGGFLVQAKYQADREPCISLEPRKDMQRLWWYF